MENDPKTKKNKFHLTKYYLHDESNDIKYRGPLSYRHLRIVGWVCMVFMALSILFSAFAKLKHSDGLATTSNVFNTIGTIALPPFLIANFGFILRHHNKLKKILLYSYPKEYNDKIYDKLIPVAGIGLYVYAVL